MTKKTEPYQIVVNFFVTAFASLIIKTIIAPLDRIKLILQTQDSAYQVLTGERKKYKGLLDCLIRIPKEQGVLSLWRSNGTNLVKYSTSQAVNFTLHDVFNQFFRGVFQPQTSTAREMCHYLSGGAAGITACSISYPLELCQTRLAVDVGSDAPYNNEKIIKREFRGLRHCVTKIVGREGAKGLFKGYQIAIIGTGIYRTLYFGLYDTSKHYWHIYHKDGKKISFGTRMQLAQMVTMAAGLIAYPLDTVGRRLMLEAARPAHLKMFDKTLGAFKVVYKDSGIRGFWKGALTGCLRGTGAALILVIHDEFRKSR